MTEKEDMLMTRFIFSRVSIILLVVILLAVLFPTQALGWSAVNGNRTHKEIDDRAYTIIKGDKAFAAVKFPQLPSIEDNDYVNPSDQKGPGPDVAGASNCSEHYFNVRLLTPIAQTEMGSRASNGGNGPSAVEDQYTILANALLAGNSSDSAHAASWLAHYAADLNTPYHTQGTTRADMEQRLINAGGANAKSLPLPSYITGPVNNFSQMYPQVHPNDYLTEYKAFLNATKGITATEDWFDPWYWDGGIVSPKILSSHVTFEGMTWFFPNNVAGYSPLWSNANASFDYPVESQAAQASAFALATAKQTQMMADSLVMNFHEKLTPVGSFLENSIRSAATVWRASYSALIPSVTISIPDKTQPKKLKVEGSVTNLASEEADNVQFKITVSGGTLKSGEVSPSVDTVFGDNGKKMYTWNVEAAALGYCTIKLEVIGRYYKTPDLQYGITQVTAAGIVPVATKTTNAPLDQSLVFCLDNSDSMKGQPISDAVSAGIQAVDSISGYKVEMALYFFGTNSCDPAELKVGFTVNKNSIESAMKTASASGNTPLAQAISAAGDYIKGNAQGQEASIVLLTDGIETCGGDPIAAARALNPSLKFNWFFKPALASSSAPIKLQVVGFNIKDPTIEETLKQVAAAGNGNFYSASNVQQLTQELTRAVQEATGKKFAIQTWWYIAGGAVFVLLLLIMLSRRGRRAPAPAAAAASTDTVGQVRGFAAPAAQAVQSAPFCPNCRSWAGIGDLFCVRCGSAVTAHASNQEIGIQSRQSAYCPKCGTPTVWGSAFCSTCGVALSLSAPSTTTINPQASTIAYCPVCGLPNVLGIAFCNKCGNSLLNRQNISATYGTPQSPGLTAIREAGAPVQKARKQVSAAWWLLAVLFFLPGGLIAWAAVKKDEPKMASRMLAVSLLITMFFFVTFVLNWANFKMG
jgi:hypothetical protein